MEGYACRAPHVLGAELPRGRYPHTYGCDEAGNPAQSAGATADEGNFFSHAAPWTDSPGAERRGYSSKTLALLYLRPGIHQSALSIQQFSFINSPTSLLRNIRVEIPVSDSV